MTTETIIIDLARAEELLDQAAAEHPDFVYLANYGACTYVVRDEDGDPLLTSGIPHNCIVGRALVLAGLDEDLLCGVADGTVREVRGELETLGLHLTDDTVLLWGRAQGWQDITQVTWSEAVKLAKAGVSVEQRHEDAIEVIGRDPREMRLRQPSL